ncbi:MAG: sulfatase-like hydrolase/transferase [Planctomycetota bacterium]
MHQASFRAVAAALVAVAVIGHDSVSAQPNIIHIIADDMGWTDLSGGQAAYGNASAFYQTPNIDRLAAEGLAFTSAYALQTCVPSRAALLTGQAPTRTGVYNVTSIDGGATAALIAPANETKIDTQAITLGESLQAAGYTTAHFGKFHVAQTEADITAEHGYDFDFGGGTSGAPSTFFAQANGRFDTRVGPGLDPYAADYTQAYIDANLKPFANGADVDSLVGTPKHLSDAMADAAIDFMQGRLAAGDEPFYMNVAYHAVHTPIESRPDLEAKYNDIISQNGGASPDPRHDNTGYAGLLEGMDQSIGRIVAFLEDPNGDGDPSDSIAGETVLLFYGDNGGTNATDSSPLSGRKGSQQEGGLRVPLVAWSPGRVQSGVVNDEPVQSVDFYPTFLELAGAAPPNPATHPLDGQSIAPLLSGQASQLDRDGVFFHFPGYSGSNSPVSTIVLDAGANRHKLRYLYERRQYEMFDLSADIGETNNLASGDLSEVEYKLAVRGAVALRAWLDETGADYPTVRADGTPVAPPSQLPAVAVDFGAELDGLSTAEVEKLGVRLTLSAVGDGAEFDADGQSLGVASSLDGGGTQQRRNINGTLAVPEAIELSFDQDVVLKSLLLDALNVNSAESTVLRFVSGDNPFDGLAGYSPAEGYTLTSDSLSFDASSADGMMHLVEFGILGRDDLLITAGTVLALTSGAVVGGGVALGGVAFALPLEAAGAVLLDYHLDGQIDLQDFEVWRSTFGSTSDLRADGNGDGVVDAADYTLWRDAFVASRPLSAAAVPEPANIPAAALLALASTGLSRRNRLAIPVLGEAE